MFMLFVVLLFTYVNFTVSEEPDMCINIKDYGAIPGDFGDDTYAIQAAINAANNTCVYIPPGRFSISSTIVIFQKDHFRLFGAGKGNDISSVATTALQWNGPVNGTMLQVKSCANTELFQFTLTGISLDFGYTRPGVGLEHTAINANGSSHFNYFHDLDITYIDGYPGVALLVGSNTNDDVSNSRYERMTLTFGHISIRQWGSQTVNNFYENNVLIEYLEAGFHCANGTVTMNGNAFYGNENATNDVLVEPYCLETIFIQNYHEVIWNRSVVIAYHFPYRNGERVRHHPSTIRQARVISDIPRTDHLIYYEQSASLSIVDMYLGGLQGAIIYLDNQKVGPPEDFTLVNTNYANGIVLKIKGNWNYQAHSRLQTRSLYSVKFLENANTSQAIFNTPFFLQDETTYNIRGVIGLSTTSINAAHQIEWSTSGSANVIISLLRFSSDTSSISWKSLVTPEASTTYGLSPLLITSPISSLNAYTTVTFKGKITTADNGAGTYIPQLRYTNAPGNRPNIRPNSFIEVMPIGNIGAINI